MTARASPLADETQKSRDSVEGGVLRRRGSTREISGQHGMEEDDATRIEPFTDRVAADLEQAAVDRA